MYTFTSGKEVDAPVVDDLPALLWAANAGAIELHPFLGRRPRIEEPTFAVFDLDPGSPAGPKEACGLALVLHELLDAFGLRSFPKSSGAKGIHVYVPVNTEGVRFEDTKRFARAVAALLVQERPEQVTDLMPKRHRAGKVFVDWSQNDAGKSTISPYSLRGLPRPTVSVPLTWEEVEAAAGGDLRVLWPTPAEVFDRIDRHGDLFGPVLELVQSLPV
jgi:bifunctional non-homologous end joining protein LigD